MSLSFARLSAFSIEQGVISSQFEFTVPLEEMIILSQFISLSTNKNKALKLLKKENSLFSLSFQDLKINNKYREFSRQKKCRRKSFLVG